MTPQEYLANASALGLSSGQLQQLVASATNPVGNINAQLTPELAALQNLAATPLTQITAPAGVDPSQYLPKYTGGLTNMTNLLASSPGMMGNLQNTLSTLMNPFQQYAGMIGQGAVAQSLARGGGITGVAGGGDYLSARRQAAMAGPLMQAYSSMLSPALSSIASQASNQNQMYDQALARQMQQDAVNQQMQWTNLLHQQQVRDAMITAQGNAITNAYSNAYENQAGLGRSLLSQGLSFSANQSQPSSGSSQPWAGWGTGLPAGYDAASIGGARGGGGGGTPQQQQQQQQQQTQAAAAAAAQQLADRAEYQRLMGMPWSGSEGPSTTDLYNANQAYNAQQNYNATGRLPNAAYNASTFDGRDTYVPTESYGGDYNYFNAPYGD